MATKAKLEGNARYLAKFKTVSVRIPQSEWGSVASAAANAGQAISAYILQAVRERMARDQQQTDGVPTPPQDTTD